MLPAPTPPQTRRTVAFERPEADEVAFDLGEIDPIWHETFEDLFAARAKQGEPCILVFVETQLPNGMTFRRPYEAGGLSDYFKEIPALISVRHYVDPASRLPIDYLQFYHVDTQAPSPVLRCLGWLGRSKPPRWGDFSMLSLLDYVSSNPSRQLSGMLALAASRDPPVPSWPEVTQRVLLRAAVCSQPSVALKALSAGADLACADDDYGLTPLAWSTLMGDTPLSQLLLANGAPAVPQANPTTDRHLTCAMPLANALWWQDRELIHRLTAAGAHRPPSASTEDDNSVPQTPVGDLDVALAGGDHQDDEATARLRAFAKAVYDERCQSAYRSTPTLRQTQVWAPVIAAAQAGLNRFASG